jgi:hypothetical protein
MKGAQLTTLIWLANLLVLAGGGFMGYSYYSEIEGGRDTAYDRVRNQKPKEKRIVWGDQASGATGKVFSMPPLSPRARPQDRVVIDKPDPVIEVKEPTREELEEALEVWLSQNFTLLRVLSTSSATVSSKSPNLKTLILFTGMDFKADEFAKSDNDDMKALSLYGLEVVSIHFDNSYVFNPKERTVIPGDYVVFRGPARDPKYAAKYPDLEAKLMLTKDVFKTSISSKLGNSQDSTVKTGSLPKDHIPARDAAEEEMAKESTFNEKTGEWHLERGDFANAVAIDDMARYARVVYDNQGKAVGIQITDNVPESSLIVQRGGRRGDIIKSVNGKPVNSVADAKRIGGTDYKNGVTRFEVVYERDGVPGTKVFNVPPKKK